ncbi:MAG: lytic murein transglycosylase [Dermatophilus congolensis]|nr:lytic murein transglycosylase [Dermatophilus congolensis]
MSRADRDDLEPIDPSLDLEPLAGPDIGADSDALRVLRLGRSRLSGVVAGLLAVGAIASGVFTVGASEGAPVSTAPVVSTSAPTTTEATTGTTTADGSAGLPGLPGLDVFTAARMVSEALAVSPVPTTAQSATRVTAVPVSNVVPTRMLAAYQRGEKVADARYPRCNLPWWLLAGIGRVESGHAAGGAVDSKGVTTYRILGPRLDGTTPGTATIADTDGGRLDGDAQFDRAVGPMQFIPGTWAGAGLDGNGDGIADPNQVDDAATSAAGYLCSAGGDMSKPADMAAAILRYNNSQQYVEDVLAGAVAYRDGVVPVNPPRRIDGAPERPSPSGATTAAPTSGSSSATARTGVPSTGTGTPGTRTDSTGATTSGNATEGTATAGTSTGTTGATKGTSGAPTPTKTSAPPTKPGPTTGTTGTKGTTGTTTSEPDLPLPSCRPAPKPTADDGTATQSPSVPSAPSASTNPSTPTPSGDATPTPTATWDPDDPRIAHLPVCEDPATAAATAAGTAASPADAATTGATTTGNAETATATS